jgi:proteasome lid subunit RPN8/RPN11
MRLFAPTHHKNTSCCCTLFIHLPKYTCVQLTNTKPKPSALKSPRIVCAYTLHILLTLHQTHHIRDSTFITPTQLQTANHTYQHHCQWSLLPYHTSPAAEHRPSRFDAHSTETICDITSVTSHPGDITQKSWQGALSTSTQLSMRHAQHIQHGLTMASRS